MVRGRDHDWNEDAETIVPRPDANWSAEADNEPIGQTGRGDDEQNPRPGGEFLSFLFPLFISDTYMTGLSVGWIRASVHRS